MTEAMPFLQKYDITFLRPPTICRRAFLLLDKCTISYYNPVGLYDFILKGVENDGCTVSCSEEIQPSDRGV